MLSEEKVQELADKVWQEQGWVSDSRPETISPFRALLIVGIRAAYLAGEKAGLEEAAKWIKCSELEPDEEGRYLIQYRQHGQVRIFIGDYIPREGWLCHMVDMEVLQWQKIVSPAAISDCATSDVEAARNTANTSKQKEKA